MNKPIDMKDVDELTTQGKQIIVNIFYHFKNELDLINAAKETLKVTGYNPTPMLINGVGSRNYAKNRKRTLIPGKNEKLYLDFVLKSELRKIIHEIIVRNNLPTTANIKQSLITDGRFRNLENMSLTRTLKDMRFVKAFISNKKFYIESKTLIYERHKYFKKLKNYKNNGKNIVYVGCCHLNLNFGSMIPATNKTPSYSAVCAGDDKGLIKNTAAFYKHGPKVDFKDRYKFWFENILIKNLVADSLIVIDFVPQQNVPIIDVPTINTKKSDIITFLKLYNLHHEEDALKPELLHVVNKWWKTVNECSSDLKEVAKKHNHEIIHIPFEHYELNPFTFVWEKLKEDLMQKNCDPNSQKKLVENIWDEFSANKLHKFTEHKWAKFLDEVKENENRMREVNVTSDEWLIKADDSASSSSSDSESCDDNDGKFVDNASDVKTEAEEEY